jgi:predicted molibdopterin-dependent oxidoreductase YjgC
MSQVVEPTKPTSPFEDALRLVHAASGSLTRELSLRAGGHGLGQVPDSLRPTATTTMVCGFCSTGCGLKVHLGDGGAIGLSPTTEYPVNLGMACPKGWEALEVTKASDRATHPLMRNSFGELRPVEWDTALEAFCRNFKRIQQKYGNESVAFISTGQIPTEEMVFLGSLAKFGMGIVHGDGNTRQCMATAATAYKQSFGFDAPPFTYDDFEQSDLLIFVGANPCIAHPILWERVMRNRRGAEIVVIDPRTTETAMQAHRHLAIQPKSDLVLFYGLANLLIQNDWIDREFINASTTGFDEFASFVSDYPLERVVEQTGLKCSQIVELAEQIHQRSRVSFWWTMGVNQSYEGTRVAQSLINLSLMTGNIGRPGTGANSITGQCNAMGSRIFSNTTGLLGGHDFTSAGDREKIATLLGINVERIPDRNSWAYHEIIDGIETGHIKGLWVIATNPAHSWINQNRFKRLRDKLEYLVVQDMYSTTETAQMADLVLPAAGWGEKEGTFINSERRLGVIKKVQAAPGQAIADFSIFRLISEYWGCGEMFRGWTSPDKVFEVMKRISAGQPCDLSGIVNYKMIDEQGGIQWPCLPSESPPATERRLFEDGRFYHADGRARFLFEAPRPNPEPTDSSYPLTLLTGRGTASQWHTQTRTSKSAVLRKLYPRSIYVEIHPVDAKTFHVESGKLIDIVSRRGRISAKAFVTSNVQPGQLFVPMHYEQANQLTLDVFDPYSKQPSYKQCSVRLEPAAFHARTGGSHE